MLQPDVSSLSVPDALATHANIISQSLAQWLHNIRLLHCKKVVNSLAVGRKPS